MYKNQFVYIYISIYIERESVVLSSVNALSNGHTWPAGKRQHNIVDVDRNHYKQDRLQGGFTRTVAIFSRL